MTSRPWQRGWVQVCAVALASGVVTAVVVLQLRPDREPEPEVPSLEAIAPKGPPATRVQATLASRFRVFRTPARRSDRVPVARSDSPQGDVDAGYVRENGLDVSLGRRLRASPRVFAVPARGSVCLIYQRAGGECTPVTLAHRNFQVHTCGHLPRGRFELSGLVADPVESVILRLRGGRRVRLPVSRNFVDVTRAAREPADLPSWVELRGPRVDRREKVPRLTMRSLACAGPG